MPGSEAKENYTDQAYKDLSKVNGRINVMTKTQLVEELRRFNLDTDGIKNVLKKRLKAHYKRMLIENPKEHNGLNGYDYLVVIDFEATCEENKKYFAHEIIEFPAILVDIAKQEIVDEFHHYVRPVVNGKLTKFCTDLTGITQDVVDSSLTFPEVLKKFEEWLAAHRLNKRPNFAIVTDGPWDMSRFMYLQCRASKIPLPRWSRKWVNIRKCYCNAYNCPKVSLKSMLEGLHMEFEGRCHSGIADSRNIARVLIQMIKDGCNILVNERMFVDKVSDVTKVVNDGKKKFASISKRESIPDSRKESASVCKEDDDLGKGEEEEDEEIPCHKIDAGCDDANKQKSKQERLKCLEKDLESCEDLLYYMSLKRS